MVVGVQQPRVGKCDQVRPMNSTLATGLNRVLEDCQIIYNEVDLEI